VVIYALNAQKESLRTRPGRNKMIEIGRLCMKTAGRDARKKCVIVDIIDKNYVLIDGETRRKKCNINHVEPMDKVLDIKKGASHKQIVDAFDKIGIKVKESRKKEKPKKRENN